MYRLPDGSGFFVGSVGAREPGLVNFLKYERVGCARPWLFFYRMYREARTRIRPKPNICKALSYAWMVNHK